MTFRPEYILIERKAFEEIYSAAAERFDQLSTRIQTYREAEEVRLLMENFCELQRALEIAEASSVIVAPELRPVNVEVDGRPYYTEDTRILPCRDIDDE